RLTDLFTLRIHPDETFFKTEETGIDPFVKLFNNEIKNKDVNVISFENGKKIISANGTPIVETNSNELRRINFEKAKDIPESFLFYDEDLEEANLPNASRILDNTFFNNKNMKVLNIPKAQYIGNNILYNNKVMEEIYLPSATYIGSDFLSQNENKKIHISDKLKNFNNILFKIQSKER
ncbi:MAG: leucine-rich repeat protein, partial [Alphaproteobacteria bacterium]|nr:leucine-rich repeat protein [Alphaproteobacteria bacterium]